MVKAREFRIVGIGKDPAVTHIIPTKLGVPLYTCDASKPSTSLALYKGDSATGVVIGAARVSPTSWDILLAIGDPRTRYASWELMKNKTRISKTDPFIVSLELPSGARRDFRWKVAHGKKTLRSKTDKIHFKLVDESTDEVVAHYSPKSKPEGTMDGKLSLFWDLGGNWDMTMILVGLGLLKYNSIRPLGNTFS